MVEDGIEESVGLPGAAREDAILGAPIAELAAESTEGGGSQVRPARSEQPQAQSL